MGATTAAGCLAPGKSIRPGQADRHLAVGPPFALVPDEDDSARSIHKSGSIGKTLKPWGVRWVTGPGAVYHPRGGKPGPAHRTRQLVSASGARFGAHARGWLLGLHRAGAELRRADRGDPVAAAPRAALPTTAGLRSPGPGTAGMGGRSPLQGALPRQAHRAPAPRRRRRAQTPGRSGVLPGARSQPPAVGAVAGR